MIIKYALFTLTVSAVPMLLIVKDWSVTNQLMDKIRYGCYNLNSELINNIINTGVYAYFFTVVQHNGEANNDPQRPTQTIFTESLLKTYSGEDGKPLYLAILGEVFDVTKGAKHYGPGQAYNIFTGRDGSRAFVTGDFTESGVTDDIMDLSSQDLRSLNGWLKFYFKEYPHKGKLDGRFYNKNGQATGYYHKIKQKIEDSVKEEIDKNISKMKFPPCNVEWTPEEGSRVWCSERSGGIDRDWVGVPRKLYEPGADTSRCACINTNNPLDDKSASSANLMEYEDCHPLSTSCYSHN